MIVFGVSAATLVTMLVTAAIVMTGASDSKFRDVRRQGPHVKRIGGSMLIAIGAWFAFLAAANPIYLLP